MQPIIRQYDPALTVSLTAAATESAAKVATLLKRKASRATALRDKPDATAADVRAANAIDAEIGAVVDLIQDYKQLLTQREAEAESCWQMIESQDKKVRKLWNEVQFWEADAQFNRDHCIGLNELLIKHLTEKSAK